MDPRLFAGPMMPPGSQVDPMMIPTMPPVNLGRAESNARMMMPPPSLADEYRPFMIPPISRRAESDARVRARLELERATGSEAEAYVPRREASDVRARARMELERRLSEADAGEDARTEMKRSEPEDESSKLLRDVRERIKRHMSGEDVIPEELKDIKKTSNLGSSLEKKLRGRIKNMLSDLSEEADTEDEMFVNNEETPRSANNAKFKIRKLKILRNRATDWKAETPDKSLTDVERLARQNNEGKLRKIDFEIPRTGEMNLTNKLKAIFASEGSLQDLYEELCGVDSDVITADGLQRWVKENTNFLFSRSEIRALFPNPLDNHKYKTLLLQICGEEFFKYKYRLDLIKETKSRITEKDGHFIAELTEEERVTIQTLCHYFHNTPLTHVHDALRHADPYDLEYVDDLVKALYQVYEIGVSGEHMKKFIDYFGGKTNIAVWVRMMSFFLRNLVLIEPLHLPNIPV